MGKLDVSCLSDTVMLQLPSTKSVPNNRFEYIAHKQQTKFVFDPVHTINQKTFFEDLLTNNFYSTTEPNWHHFASFWNPSATGITVFYKTPEHLKLYHSILNVSAYVLAAQQTQLIPSQTIFNNYIKIQELTHTSENASGHVRFLVILKQSRSNPS